MVHFCTEINTPEKPRDPVSDRAFVDKLLKGPEPKGSTSAPGATSSDTGSTAGIAGATPAASNKPSFMDRMANLNQHVSKESAGVHVSINPHKD